MPTHTAAKTQNFLRLSAALESIQNALLQVLRQDPFSRKNPRILSDGSANVLRGVIQEALPYLNFQFADPNRQLPPGTASKMRNFRKMLEKLKSASSGAELGLFLAEMEGKTTDAWKKFLEYRDLALAIVDHLDEEYLPSVSIAGYTIQPFNTGRGNWTDEDWATLRYVLQEGTRLLKANGLERYARGAVLAYPTQHLPASAGPGGALAAYRRTDDLMWIAAGGDPKRVLQSFIHETGHRVYWKFIGSVGWKAWDEYFEKDTGAPDVDAVLRAWENWLTQPTDSYGKNRSYNGRFFIVWMQHLLRTGQHEMAMWSEIIAQKAEVDEKVDPYTGDPKKNQTPGLDVIYAKKNEIRAFLTPVTAYSATEAGELFAEAFAHYIVKGPQRLHPKLRAELRKALPMLKVGHSPLTLQPDYGTSDAAVPREGMEEGPSAYRVAARFIQ
jgi:hypothetical protein